MSASLAELYQEPDIQYGARCWRDVYPQTPDDLVNTIGNLGRITVPNELAVQLDGLDEHSDARKASAILLGCLPTKTLLGTFGQEVTAWTLGNDDVHRRTEDHTEALDVMGFNGALLLQAVSLSRLQSKSPKSSEVLSQQAVMETILGNGLDELDLPALLSQAAKPGVSLSEKRIADYGLVRLSAEFGLYLPGGRVYSWHGKESVEKPGLYYDLWLDSPVGFALTYKGHPQAIIGVQAKGDNELFIRQLQGTQGIKYATIEKDGKTKYPIIGYKSARGLAPLDWRKFLVSASSLIAKQLGYNSVGIVTGSEVPSFSRCRLSHAQAREAYDVQAERLGFTQGDDKNWHRPLDISEIEQNALANVT